MQQQPWKKWNTQCVNDIFKSPYHFSHTKKISSLCKPNKCLCVRANVFSFLFFFFFSLFALAVQHSLRTEQFSVRSPSTKYPYTLIQYMLWKIAWRDIYIFVEKNVIHIGFKWREHTHIQFSFKQAINWEIDWKKNEFRAQFV